MDKNSASRVKHSVNRLLLAYLERISSCCLVNKKFVQSHNFLCDAQILLDIRGIIPHITRMLQCSIWYCRLELTVNSNMRRSDLIREP